MNAIDLVLFADAKIISTDWLRILAQALKLPSEFPTKNLWRHLCSVFVRKCDTMLSSNGPLTSADTSELYKPVNILNEIEQAPRSHLVVIASQHCVKFSSLSNRNDLFSLITTHITKGYCSKFANSPLSDCAKTIKQIHDSAEMPCDDFQLAVLSSIVKKIKQVPLKHVLSLYGVEYDESDSLKKLCKKLKGYIVRLKKGKRAEA